MHDRSSNNLKFKALSKDHVRTLKIGTLAPKTGTSTPTIYYYESIGLRPVATRQEGGQLTPYAENVARLHLRLRWGRRTRMRTARQSRRDERRLACKERDSMTKTALV